MKLYILVGLCFLCCFSACGKPRKNVRDLGEVSLSSVSKETVFRGVLPRGPEGSPWRLRFTQEGAGKDVGKSKVKIVLRNDGNKAISFSRDPDSAVLIIEPGHKKTVFEGDLTSLALVGRSQKQELSFITTKEEAAKFSLLFTADGISQNAVVKIKALYDQFGYSP